MMENNVELSQEERKAAFDEKMRPGRELREEISSDRQSLRYRVGVLLYGERFTSFLTYAEESIERHGYSGINLESAVEKIDKVIEFFRNEKDL